MENQKKSLASIVAVFTEAVNDLRTLRDENDVEAAAKLDEASRLSQEAHALTDEADVADRYAKNIEKNILGGKKGFLGLG